MIRGLEVNQDDVDAGYMRVCMFYTDGYDEDEGGDNSDETMRTSTAATLCSDVVEVDNVNDDPEGRPALALVSLGGTNDNDVIPDASGNPPSSLAEGQRIMSVLSTGSSVISGTDGQVTDEDGIPTTGTTDKDRWQHSIQTAPDRGGPWGEVHHAVANVHASMLTYIIDQDDVDAGFIRTCVFYTDYQNTPEGGSAGTQAGREAGTLCSAPLAVANVNDAPVAEASTVTVTSDITYRFSRDDFDVER